MSQSTQSEYEELARGGVSSPSENVPHGKYIPRDVHGPTNTVYQRSQQPDAEQPQSRATRMPTGWLNTAWPVHTMHHHSTTRSSGAPTRAAVRTDPEHTVLSISRHTQGPHGASPPDSWFQGQEGEGTGRDWEWGFGRGWWNVLELGW